MLCVNIFFAICLFIKCTEAIEDDEYALYDLVEELGENFYDFLGVRRNAEAIEIRKAYRQLSLQWHPDKNKDPGAEATFRNIVAVYEVLKDSNLREKYNHILDYGLPDWRQPIYYYRKVRKFGLLEILVILLVILTIGHFLVARASYWEKCFTMEEVVRSNRKRKRENRRLARSQDVEEAELDEIVTIALQQIPRPKLTDLLPFMMIRGLFWVIKLPVVLVYAYLEEEKDREERRKVREERRLREEERLQADEERRRERRELLQSLQPVPNQQNDINYDATDDSFGHISQDAVEEEFKEEIKELKDGPWTAEDLHLLAQAVSRYPGGTPQRWEKVSEFVCRPVKEVIKHAKEIKTNYAITVSAKAQGITGVSENFATALPKDGLISTIEPEGVAQVTTGNTARKRGPTKVKKTVERTLMISNSALQSSKDTNSPEATAEEQSETANSTASKTNCESWSQDEQKALEKALQLHPRGCQDRWDKIADCVPGRTKEECVSRFSHLAKLVKQKREVVKQK